MTEGVIGSAAAAGRAIFGAASANTSTTDSTAIRQQGDASIAISISKTLQHEEEAGRCRKIGILLHSLRALSCERKGVERKSTLKGTCNCQLTANLPHSLMACPTIRPHHRQSSLLRIVHLMN